MTTPERYVAVLRALRQHHRDSGEWYATAEVVGGMIPIVDENTDPTMSASRTLVGLVEAGLVHSTRRAGISTREWRRENESHRKPFGSESWINQPARYSTTALGDMVNEMLDLERAAT